MSVGPASAVRERPVRPFSAPPHEPAPVQLSQDEALALVVVLRSAQDRGLVVTVELDLLAERIGEALLRDAR